MPKVCSRKDNPANYKNGGIQGWYKNQGRQDIHASRLQLQLLVISGFLSLVTFRIIRGGKRFWVSIM